MGAVASRRCGIGICPPIAPPKADVLFNMHKAKGRSGSVPGPSDYLWFYNQVRNGGPWDYKQKGQQFEAFGNFNYGATGWAMGIPEQILLRAAGWAQLRAGTAEEAWGDWSEDAPYGDDPSDQAWIKKGIEFAKQKGY